MRPCIFILCAPLALRARLRQSGNVSFLISYRGAEALLFHRFFVLKHEELSSCSFFATRRIKFFRRWDLSPAAWWKSGHLWPRKERQKNLFLAAAGRRAA